MKWVCLILLVAALCVAGYMWLALGERAESQAAAARESEAEALKQHGLVVAQLATTAHLRTEVALLEAQSAELRQALEKARKTMPRSKPVAVVKASTGPIEVPSPTETTVAGGEVTPSSPPCLLHPNDFTDIRVGEVVLASAAGNQVLVGHAAAYKLNPETLLFEGSFNAPVTSYEIAPPADRGWAPWVTYVSAGAAFVAGAGLVYAASR